MENQIPQSNINPQVEPAPPKQSFVTYPMLFLVIILTVIISSLGTYFIVSTKTTKTSQPASSAITTQPSSVPNNTPIQTPVTSNNFPKRQFGASKNFFQTYSYPQSLISISDQYLMGMKCTPQYLKQASEEFTLGTNPDVKLTDNTQLQLISKVKSSIGKDISTFMSCVTDDNRTIVAYEVWGGGGGSTNTAYFSLANSGVIDKATIIPNDGSPYWTCQQPLQLSTSDKLYFQCGGGDGGYGSASIYEIDLNTNTSTVLYKCTSQMQNEGETPTITCK